MVMTNDDTIVIWADQRRAEGLLTGTAPPSFQSELWVRSLDGGFVLPLCVGVPVEATRLAVTPAGRLALASRRVDGALSVAGYDTRTRQFEGGGSCGRLLFTSSVGRPAVMARDEDVFVAAEFDGGVWRLVIPNRGVLPPARPLNVMGACSQPVLASADAGVVEGGLCTTAMSPIQLTLGGVLLTSPSEEATAFSLVPQMPEPTVFRVDALGDVYLHDLLSAPGRKVSRSVPGQQPLAAQGAVLGFELADGSTEVWSGDAGASFDGRIVGLAVSRDRGVVATQHTTGVVRGTSFTVTPTGISAVPPQELLTFARLLQRRPSVTWWDEAQRWLVMWEESEGPSTWRPRAAVVGADWSATRLGLALAPQTLLEWPRLARRPDGGLMAYGRIGAQTALFDRVDGGPDPVGSFAFVARNVVPGATSHFAWGDPDQFNNHLESVTYRRPNMEFNASTVSCAAWTSTDGGAFIITRDTDAGAFVERISQLQQPTGAHQRLAREASAGCVATRPGAEGEVAFAYTTPGAIIVEGREQPPFFSRVEAANVSGLQLAAYGSDGWVVAWRGDGGVFAAVVETTTRTLRLDESGVAHSLPTISASPHGGVAVAWTSLIEDSVEVRLVVIEPADDGGVDAGVVDGGAPDGGPSLDGQVDAGGTLGGPVEFVPVCGCQVSRSSLLLGLVVLIAYRRRLAQGRGCAS